MRKNVFRHERAHKCGGRNYGYSGDDDGNDNDGGKGWTPRHHEPQPPEQDNNNKICSVTEASRLHEGKDISVIGAISGIQPLRKMIKGVSVQCFKCNTVYEKKYDKPEPLREFCSYREEYVNAHNANQEIILVDTNGKISMR